MIKRLNKPEGATLQKSEAITPSLPPSTVGEPITDAKEETTTKTSHIKRAGDDLLLKDKMFFIQNAAGSVQTSQEWANQSIQLKTDEERKAKFEKYVREYYNLLIKVISE